MTDDTTRALDAIRPIAEQLNIKIDADDKFLYLNDQAIGIACNSTYATIMEAIGYIFFEQYPRFRSIYLTDVLKDDIRRYWISRDVLRKIQGIEKREAKDIEQSGSES